MVLRHNSEQRFWAGAVVFKRVNLVLFVALLSSCAGMLGACATNDLPFLTTEGLPDAPRPETGKLIADGRTQFTAEHYGNAVERFAKAVELDPKNSEAWLGLAAAYDQLNRFDEADRAYAKAQELAGATPSILNNLGYSYLLRGNFDKSRATLDAARRGDPNNPYILNNIDILNHRLAEIGQAPVAIR